MSLHPNHVNSVVSQDVIRDFFYLNAAAGVYVTLEFIQRVYNTFQNNKQFVGVIQYENYIFDFVYEI